MVVKVGVVVVEQVSKRMPVKKNRKEKEKTVEVFLEDEAELALCGRVGL